MFWKRFVASRSGFLVIELVVALALFMVVVMITSRMIGQSMVEHRRLSKRLQMLTKTINTREKGS